MPEFQSFTTPEAHGAVGDGSTNDLAAWQAAVNAANVVLVRQNNNVAYNWGGGTLSVPGRRLIFAPFIRPTITNGTIAITGSWVKIFGFDVPIICTTANVRHVTIGNGGNGRPRTFTGGGCWHLQTNVSGDEQTRVTGSNNACYHSIGGDYNNNGEPEGWWFENMAGFCLNGAAVDVSSGRNVKCSNSIGVMDGQTAERCSSTFEGTQGSSVWMSNGRQWRIGSPDAGSSPYNEIVLLRDGSKLTMVAIRSNPDNSQVNLDQWADITNGVLHYMWGEEGPLNGGEIGSNSVGSGGVIVVWKDDGTGWRASGSSTFNQIW